MTSGDASGSVLEDSGHTLILNGAGQEDTSGLPVETIACVLAELHAPAAVTSQMEATRALDGMQTATWGPFTARWTYHPDNGLDLILTS